LGAKRWDPYGVLKIQNPKRRKRPDDSLPSAHALEAKLLEVKCRWSHDAQALAPQGLPNYVTKKEIRDKTQMSQNIPACNKPMSRCRMENSA